MPTKITAAPNWQGITGSGEKRLDAEPNGRLWVCVVSQFGAGATGNPATLKFFYSDDAGATWRYEDDSDIHVGEWQVYPSFFIDADGYAHCVWSLHERSPQVMRYARGRPRRGGGWSWTIVTITPGSGRISYHVDVVAHRQGSGWVAWVGYGRQKDDPGPKVAQVNIAADGRLTVASAIHGPPSVAGFGPFPVLSLEFRHAGDGKTPGAIPDLWVTAGSHSTAGPIYAFRASYSGGNTWTWSTGPIEVDTGVDLTKNLLATVYDGERLCVLWCPYGSTQLRFAEVANTGGTVTRRDLPTWPVTTPTNRRVIALSLAHDPATDDLYAVAYDEHDGDVWWSRLSRATNTWSAWAVAAQRAASAVHGKLQLLRHPQKDAVDLVWATDNGPGLTIYHQQLVALSRAPSAPALIYPANGARVDLATGATFTWDYKPTGPGDTQQAWSFRRTDPATQAVSYWNAGASAFQAAQVWNPGADEWASFPPGAWTNGKSWPWTVATRSATGVDSGFAPARTVVGTAAPEVDVVAPAGIVFTDATPLVSWTYTSTDAQRDYEVRIVVDAPTVDPTNPGPAVWSSGVISSSTARSARVEEPLEDGATYRAWVRTTSAVGVPSAWVSSQFTLMLAPPSGPLVEVGAGYSYPDDVPRVRLRLQARSNFLGPYQATVYTGPEVGYGWVNGPNSILYAQEADPANGIAQGGRLRAGSFGQTPGQPVFGGSSIVTEVGQPPEAPPGEPQPTGPYDWPVVEGADYTVVASIRAAAVARAARVGILWYTADDDPTGSVSSLLAQTDGDQVNLSTETYVQATLTASAPPGAKRAAVFVMVLTPLSGEDYYVTSVSFHPGTDTAVQPGGYYETQTMRIERSLDQGATWEAVTSRQGLDYYQRATTVDRLAPFGVEVWYRGYTDVNGANGEVLSSAASPVAKLVLESADRWVIRDPDDVDGEVFALIEKHDRADEDQAVVSRPAGRQFPVVDTEGPQGATGSVEMYVPGPLRDKTIELLRRGVPLYLFSPIGERRHVRFLRRDYEPVVAGSRVITAEYVQVS